MELGSPGLDKEKNRIKQGKNNQNYCASDAPSLGFSYVSKTHDR